MGAPASRRGPPGRGRATAGPDAGALMEVPGDQRGHGPPLRASRQAARDDRLERGTRTLDAGPPRRPALRAGRRRRRVRGIRGAHRVEALAGPRGPHARCVILVETCEESGSADLPAYMDALRVRIGSQPRGVPRRVLRQLRPALDRDIAPGAGRRGAVGGGPRRGHPFGRQRDRPSSFRIVRQLLSRLEDEPTGRSDRVTSTSRSRPSGSSRRGRWPRRSATSAPASLRPRHAGRALRSDRAGPRSHLAAGARDHGRGRNPVHRRRRERPAAAYRHQGLAPRAADPRRTGRRAPAEGAVRDGSRRTGRASGSRRRRRAGAGMPRPWPAGSSSRSSAPPRSTSGGRRCPRAWEGRSRS